MAKGLHKNSLRKVDNPHQWMIDDARMELIQQIKAEIEREREICNDKSVREKKTNPDASMYYYGKSIALCEFLSFLSDLEKKEKPTLQEQPVKTNIVEDLKHYLATTPKEQIKKDWESLKEWDKVGPSVSEFLGWEQPVKINIRKELASIEFMGVNDARDSETIARHFYELGCSEKPNNHLEQPVSEGLEEDVKSWFFNEISSKINVEHTMYYYFQECARRYYELGRQSKQKASEELEEEFKKYWDEMPPETILDKEAFANTARHFAQWQKEKDERTLRKFFNDRNQGDASFYDLLAYREGHRDGMDEHKEEMLKEAVEGIVTTRSMAGNIVTAHIDHQFKDGQKVRIIIVKED